MVYSLLLALHIVTLVEQAYWVQVLRYLHRPVFLGVIPTLMLMVLRQGSN